ncbi:hypothetical protein CKAH01_09255 [Colletotrichum kahawae]|uniref:Uncharacterized protein n=1 Tax=Colletotrichum kahawae TaxID=34407 RepID=A0AAD9XZ33_COLKA|nr:hypothetical protein CKAH01_09255 [Colletotrichum kahawae]
MIRRFGPQVQARGFGIDPPLTRTSHPPLRPSSPSHSNLPDTNWPAAASPRLGESFPPATPQRRSPHLSLAR